MADLVVTVPEPTDTSSGLSVLIDRSEDGVYIIVTYGRSGVRRSATLRPADFTGAQRTQMQSVIQFIVAAAKASMGF